MNNDTSRLGTIIQQVIRKTGLAARLDPEDAAQDLDLAVRETLERYKVQQEKLGIPARYKTPDDVEPGLLYTMVYRRAIEMLRSPSLSRSGIFRRLSEEPTSFSEQVARLGPERERTPEQLVAAREVLLIVARVLTPREKVVIIRLHCEELTQEEVAEELHLSRQRVQQIERAAMAKLRRKA